MNSYKGITCLLYLSILLVACSAPTPTPTKLACDATLWQHVYHPDRLKILDDCFQVSGIVSEVRHEADGDAHIILNLDIYLDGHQTLVTEAICVYTVTQSDAVQACSGFNNTVTIPQAGEHVVIVGTHVLDTIHGWEEIHPITSLEVI